MRSLHSVSNCGITLVSDEEVQCTTTSGLADFAACRASVETLMRSLLPSSAISPTSRPTLFGSISTAATMRKPLRSASWCATAQPIGPSPTCITRIVIAIGDLQLVIRDSPTNHQSQTLNVTFARATADSFRGWARDAVHPCRRELSKVRSTRTRGALTTECQLRHRRAPRAWRPVAARHRAHSLAQYQRESNE